jgi:type I restriction enzyme S subunit
MDAETAALFPDSFEPSELGEIPKGWRVSSLSDVTTYLKRGIQPKYLEKGGVLVLNQKCVRDFTVSFDNARRHDNTKKSISGRELFIGDVVVNSTGVGTLGRVAQVLFLPETLIVDSHVTILRFKPDLFRLHTFGLSLFNLQSEIESLGEGTTGQTELSRTRLGSVKVIVPPVFVQEKFEKSVGYLRKKIVENNQESISLASVRDTLLPKLMSGEIRVKEAEKIVQEVA